MEKRSVIIKHALILAMCVLTGITAVFSWYGRSITEAEDMRYSDSLYINGNESFVTNTYYSVDKSLIRGDTAQLDHLGGSDTLNTAIAPGDTLYFRTDISRADMESLNEMKSTFVSVSVNNIVFPDGLADYLTLGCEPMKPVSDFVGIDQQTISVFPLAENIKVSHKTVSLYWYLHFSENYINQSQQLAFTIDSIRLVFN